MKHLILILCFHFPLCMVFLYIISYVLDFILQVPHLFSCFNTVSNGVHLVILGVISMTEQCIESVQVNHTITKLRMRWGTKFKFSTMQILLIQLRINKLPPILMLSTRPIMSSHFYYLPRLWNSFPIITLFQSL